MVRPSQVSEVGGSPRGAASCDIGSTFRRVTAGHFFSRLQYRSCADPRCTIRQRSLLFIRSHRVEAPRRAGDRRQPFDSSPVFMRHALHCLVLVAGAVLASAGATAPAAQAARGVARDTANPQITELVSRLTLDRYKATVKGLTQFGDRRQGT